MKQKFLLLFILVSLYFCSSNAKDLDKKNYDSSEIKEIWDQQGKKDTKKGVSEVQDEQKGKEIFDETVDLSEDVAVSCESDDDCAFVFANPCITPRCDKEKKVCVFEKKENLTPCNDSPCYKGALCIDGVCNKSGMIPINCDDNNPCTDDFCVDGECFHSNNLNFCDDHNPCTVKDSCKNGVCVGEFTENCKCHDDSDCEEFNDNDLCNGKIGCVEGYCRVIPGSIVNCSKYKAPPCKFYECVPESGECVLKSVKNGTVCDDNNPCTVSTVCKDGECVGENVCECEESSDCEKFEDNNLCNGKLVCVDNRCVVNFESVVDCSEFDEGQCFYYACNPESGKCEKVAKASGTPCVDENLCTRNDQCVNGECVGESVDCNDFNVCTEDLCDPELGCFHQFLDIPCDDSNPCTVSDFCMSGKCFSKEFKDCDDNNPCTNDFCDIETGNCVHENINAPCDDNNPCTEGDVCSDGKCKPGEYVCEECDSDFDCLQYNDDDYCNGVLKCESGKCVIDPDSYVLCDESQNTECMKNLCVPETGQCELMPVNDGKPCKTDSLCLINGKCVNGECVGETVSCDDNNPCTQDVCNESTGCEHIPQNGIPCDDDNPCTEGDFCENGECVSGDTNVCTTPCETDEECKAVDDGDLCNGVYRCIGGFCLFDPESVVECEEVKDECKESVCDPVDGKCKIKDKPDGTPCDDGNLCSVNDECTNGICSGEVADCDDNNPCTNDSCSPFFGCIHFNNESSCEDGNLCTKNDKCSSGVCVPGEEVVCNDDNVCTDDFCDPDKGCVFSDITEELCDDENPCTKDLCDALTGCYHEFICPEYCDNGLDDDGDGKVDCDDPDCENAKVCTGEGMCFPVSNAGCNSGDSVDLSDSSYEDKIISYGCTFGDYSGKEVSFTLIPPCNGKVKVVVESEFSSDKLFFDVFIISDKNGVCDSVNCTTYGFMYYIGNHGKAEAIFNGIEGEKYYIVIDGRNGDEGVFNYFVNCDCVY